MEATSARAKQLSQKPRRPKLKAFLSNPYNPYPFKSIPQSPTSHGFQVNDNPSPNNRKSRSKTLPPICFNSFPHTHFKRYHSEVYNKRDEFTNGCLGFLRTLGPKIRYRM